MAKKKKERVFSAHEIANICGVVNQTAINWIEKGHLDAFRTPGGQYRVYPDVLARFLNDHNIRLPREVQDILSEQKRIDQILIIDGDRAVTEHLRVLMGRLFPGAIVQVANDALEAGRAITGGPVLIFVDLELPGVDGVRLCGQIKKDETLFRPLVVATTSAGDGAMDEAVLGAGADAVLRKPVDESELPLLINRLADERAARHEG